MVNQEGGCRWTGANSTALQWAGASSNDRNNIKQKRAEWHSNYCQRPQNPGGNNEASRGHLYSWGSVTRRDAERGRGKRGWVVSRRFYYRLIILPFRTENRVIRAKECFPKRKYFKMISPPPPTTHPPVSPRFLHQTPAPFSHQSVSPFTYPLLMIWQNNNFLFLWMLPTHSCDCRMPCLGPSLCECAFLAAIPLRFKPWTFLKASRFYHFDLVPVRSQQFRKAWGIPSTYLFYFLK